jgi:hypothetical protein
MPSASRLLQLRGSIGSARFTRSNGTIKYYCQSELIDNPTYKMCAFAIMKNWNAIKFIEINKLLPYYSPQLCSLAKSQNKYAENYVDKIMHMINYRIQYDARKKLLTEYTCYKISYSDDSSWFKKSEFKEF